MSPCQSVAFTANPKSHSGFLGEPSALWRGLPARKPDHVGTEWRYQPRESVFAVKKQQRQEHVWASGLEASATSMHAAYGNLLLGMILLVAFTLLTVSCKPPINKMDYSMAEKAVAVIEELSQLKSPKLEKERMFFRAGKEKGSIEITIHIDEKTLNEKPQNLQTLSAEMSTKYGLKISIIFLPG